MGHARILDWFREHLFREFGIRKEVVSVDAAFRSDCGLDSIDEMLLMMQIEDQFEIIIMDRPESEMDDYFQVTTVGDAIEYILRRMHEPQSPKTAGIL